MTAKAITRKEVRKASLSKIRAIIEHLRNLERLIDQGLVEHRSGSVSYSEYADVIKLDDEIVRSANSRSWRIESDLVFKEVE